VRRWGFEEQFYPAIFGICCALANYDILAGEGGSLRMQEEDEYRVMLTRICTKGKKTLEDVRERMKRRRSKRAAVREGQERIDREAVIDPEEDE
jgi:RNase P/RNase MRP subunit p30